MATKMGTYKRLGTTEPPKTRFWTKVLSRTITTTQNRRGLIRSLKRGANGVESGSPREEEATELIFKLERRGTGWAEEILPTLVVEHRPIREAKSEGQEESSAYAGHQRRGNTSGVATYSELEKALLSVGVRGEEVKDIIAVAVAWRVTDGGLILVDRRRRSKALRNIKLLVPYLESLGLHVGPDSIGSLLVKSPLLILCNVESNETWDKRMVELAVYWFEHGTCQVPSNYKACPELSRWTHRIRRHKAVGKLSPDQIKLLEGVGFDFGLGITSEWESMFDKILDFILENGHSQVPPQTKRGRSLSLHEWTELQRIAYAAGRLVEDHVNRLESVNFDWNAKYISSWLKFYQQHKTSTLDGNGVGNGAAGNSAPNSAVPGLRYWKLQQQVLWAKNELLPEREALLREIAFDFNPYNCKFNEMCKGLSAMMERHKADSVLALLARLYDDLMLPPTAEAGPPKLEAVHIRQIFRWLKIQQMMRKNGMLSHEQVSRLDQLGVMWEGFEWQLNFEALLKYRATHGHCDVGKAHRLSQWVSNMRINRHDLPMEYKKLLDMAGFTWEKKGAWTRMLTELRRFHHENGHVRIPKQNEDHHHLGAWLMNQRALWRKGKLSMHQIQRLQAMGVTK